MSGERKPLLHGELEIVTGSVNSIDFDAASGSARARPMRDGTDDEAAESLGIDAGIHVDSRRRAAAKKESMWKSKAAKALVAATCFTLVFMVGELIGGFYAKSLAIMTDAAHLVCFFLCVSLLCFSGPFRAC
jgi:hypothetical protein